MKAKKKTKKKTDFCCDSCTLAFGSALTPGSVWLLNAGREWDNFEIALFTKKYFIFNFLLYQRNSVVIFLIFVVTNNFFLFCFCIYFYLILFCLDWAHFFLYNWIYVPYHIVYVCKVFCQLYYVFGSFFCHGYRTKCEKINCWGFNKKHSFKAFFKIFSFDWK